MSTTLQSGGAKQSGGTKCLLFSPVRLDPETLALALQSHQALRAPGFEIDRMYFDDNVDVESSRILNNDPNALIVHDVTGLPGASALEHDYRAGDTHQWNQDNIGRVAAIKNKAIEAFLKSDYTHLFFVDSDVILHPDTVAHLLSLDLPIVSEVFWTRWQNEQDVWMPQVWDVHPYAFNSIDNILALRAPGVRQVGGLGACTLIRRDVFEAGVNFSPVAGLQFEGEDRHFCVRAAAAGFSLHADTSYSPFHVYRKSQLQEATNWYDAGASPDYFRTLWLDDKWEAHLTGRGRAASSGGTKSLAICLPGQTFSSAYLMNVLDLMDWVRPRFNARIYNSYTSNPSLTRQSLTRMVLSGGGSPPDYVLWMDDDNILTDVQLEMLVHGLETHPEIDLVAGWCDVAADVYAAPRPMTSVGTFDARSRCVAFTAEELTKANGLVAIEWTGFPAVLMRGSLLARLGHEAFRFIHDEVNAPENGFFGEDVSFCKSMLRSGARSAVDTRVKVPHLKLRDANSGTSSLTASLNIQEAPLAQKG